MVKMFHHAFFAITKYSFYEKPFHKMAVFKLENIVVEDILTMTLDFTQVLLFFFHILFSQK